MIDIASTLDESDRIGHEIVAIASNPEFGELRNEMVQRLVMKEFIGKGAAGRDPMTMKMTMLRTMMLLATCIEAMTDEISGADVPDVNFEDIVKEGD